MTLKIRRVRPDDAGTVARLSEQLGYPVEAKAMAARIGRALADEAHVVLVAEDSGAVVGWIHVRRTFCITNEPAAEMAALVVDERARGAGIGARLVAAAEEWARESGFGEMIVRSQEKRERAHAFYRRLGYALKKTSLVFSRPLL